MLSPTQINASYMEKGPECNANTGALCECEVGYDCYSSFFRCARIESLF